MQAMLPPTGFSAPRWRRAGLDAAGLIEGHGAELVALLPRNRPVHFIAPVITTSTDLGDAMKAVLQAVAAGELAPDEAVSIASLIETRRRTIETIELDLRVAALEQSKVASP